jgi:hypothetical protein
MAEMTVVVGNFFSAEEAQAARLSLEAEGIHCLITGDTPAPVNVSIFGRMNFAPIQLRVAASDAEQAGKLLAAEQAPLPPDWKSQAEDAVEGWICTNCDTAVPDAVAVCPECATPRPRP